jgi:hypothetical protein
MLHAVSWMLTACIDRDTVCDLPQIRGVFEEVNAYILHPILCLRKKMFNEIHPFAGNMHSNT